MGALVCSFLKRKLREGAMSRLKRFIFALGIATVFVGWLSGAKAFAQADPNSAPDPYRTVENWAKLPEGRTWGQVISADIDRDGKSIWVVERCGGTSCAKSDLAPVLKFDSSGNLVKSFGAGMIVRPHGLFIDKNNNVWVTDGDAENGKGDQVFEFSQDGKVLLTLGKAGVAGDGPDTFNKPSDVLIAPERRHFRRGRTRAGLERADREIFGGRQIHQGVGQRRNGAGGIQQSAFSGNGFQGTAICRRSREQPHPDFRSGRKISGRMAAIRTAERRFHRQERRSLRRGLGIEYGAQSWFPARHPNRECQGRQSHGLHSRPGAESRARDWSRQMGPRRRASRRMRLETCMGRKLVRGISRDTKRSSLILKGCRSDVDAIERLAQFLAVELNLEL